MNQAEVVALMESSKDKNEWKENCQTVKDNCGGDYPPFWFASVIQSGLCDKVLGEGASELKIVSGEDALREIFNRCHK